MHYNFIESKNVKNMQRFPVNQSLMRYTITLKNVLVKV